MKKIGLQRQRYPEELKLAILKRICSGELTAIEAIRVYGINRSTVYKWLSSLSSSDNIDNLESKNSCTVSIEKEDLTEKELLKRKIEALEKSLEYERLRSEAYQTMIEIAEKEFSIQIGKKSGAKQSKK